MQGQYQALFNGTDLLGTRVRILGLPFFIRPDLFNCVSKAASEPLLPGPLGQSFSYGSQSEPLPYVRFSPSILNKLTLGRELPLRHCPHRQHTIDRGSF